MKLHLVLTSCLLTLCARPPIGSADDRIAPPVRAPLDEVDTLCIND